MKTTKWITALEDQVRSGTVPAAIYADGEIFDQEVEAIFNKSWICVAHEVEISTPGTFVQRSIAKAPILVVRGKDQKIRAFFNRCIHRGARICNYPRGRVTAWSCPYHGWSYDLQGRLTGLPFREELYRAHPLGGGLALTELRSQTFGGMIFVTANPTVEALGEYLGEFAFYLDFWFKPGGDAAEMMGPAPDRWRMATNWKPPCENFAGDSYHTLFTHRFAFRGGMLPTSALRHNQGYAVRFPALGHTANFAKAIDESPWPGIPRSSIHYSEEGFGEVQKRLFRGTRTALGHVFPNLSVHSTVRRWNAEGPIVRFWTVRTWNPLSPQSTEVLSWCLVPKNATDEFKEASYQAYRSSFGPAGTFEQDDHAVWEGITTIAAGVGVPAAQTPVMRTAPPPDEPVGPGEVSGELINEDNARTFLATWANRLVGNVHTDERSDKHV